MKENKKMNAQQHICEMAGLVLKMSLVRLIKIVQKKNITRNAIRRIQFTY